jgi:signal transduction histidine kinase
MPDASQIPAIALIAALMLAFIYLHQRFRSVRTLLWIFALGCGEIRAILIWLLSQGPASLTGPLVGNYIHSSARTSTAVHLVAESALLLSSGLFLASLSPLSFSVGRFRILYAVPYILPVLIYTSLYYCASQHPAGNLFFAYCGLAGCAIVAGLAWGMQKGPFPRWLAVTIVLGAGLICVPFFLDHNVYWPLLMVESSNMLVTALLVLFVCRRVSPGTVLATTGFLAWALPPIFLMQNHDPIGILSISLMRAGSLGQVVVAMGLILLVLEDEVDKNQTAQRRERRVRLELEAYAKQSLTARSMEEFDRESGLLCEMMIEHSCFSRAAILARGAGGKYTLIGYAGMDGATAGALDSLARRLPADSFESTAADGTPHPTLVPEGISLDLDLTPWLLPGDDLEILRLTRVTAVPMLGPDNTAEGALLLADPLNAQGLPSTDPLRADDLLPLEILAGRLQAARSQAIMLGKLIESERFAGVGQLATNVAQQLNNPLTVILGYAALLEESTDQGPERRGAEAIVHEARRMKSILERLSRFSRYTSENFLSFSIGDLITDIELLHRTDLLRNSIEFRLNLAPGLPVIFGNAQQIRQALLHAMQFAMENVQRLSTSEEKAIRIEGTSADGRVQILVSHSGHGFRDTEHVFDSFSLGSAGSEVAGLGLSLCAAIVREHRGNITAMNLEPTGGAILIDLPIS